MSQYLKSILDQQATSVAFKPADLETITRTGNRRIRQRRVAVLAGLAVVVLAAATAILLGGPGRQSPPVGSGRWPAGTVSWAAGTKIHAGLDVIDVGRVVRAYVRTSVGFAFIDVADDVYSVTEAGITRIGRLTATLPNNTDQQRLVSDPRGTLVGWVSEDPPGTLTLVVHDQATGRTRTYPYPGGPSGEGVLFFAIDDRTAYWKTPGGVYAVNVDTGREQLLVGGPAYDFEVYSVESGLIAFSPNADRTFLVGRSVDGARTLRDFSGQGLTGTADPVRLSPTGSWLSLGVVQVEGTSEVDMRVTKIAAEVYDTATGERITLRISGDPQIAKPDVWLDDTTLVVFASSGDPNRAPEELGLYTCTLPEGSCTLAGMLRFEDFDSDSPFVSSDGRWYGPPP